MYITKHDSNQLWVQNLWPNRSYFYKTGYLGPLEITQDRWHGNREHTSSHWQEVFVRLSQCNRCGLEITWKKPFTQGDRPLNMDNSVHSCKNSYEKEEPAIINNMPTVKTQNSILEECIIFSETFKDITDAKFDSLVRLYNTRVMQKWNLI